ncbi:MAG: zf-HC2 domain-containing protein [Caldimonas sp.]
MKARILSLDSDEHGAVQALLPWYANATLAAAERARVDAHLDACARCRADVEFQRHLCATPVAPPPGDVDSAWLALRARLDVPRADARPPAARAGWLAPRWLPLALGLQAAFVLALAIAWLALPRAPEYRTLGAVASSPAANALVVFRPDATEVEIRRALRAADARLVGGPTVTDAYLLRLPDLGAGSLARLRAEPAVARVESLEGEPAK